MNETQNKPRTLTSFTILFEEIKNNYNIDILNYDSFEKFIIDFFLNFNREDLELVSGELSLFESIIEKIK